MLNKSIDGRIHQMKVLEEMRKTPVLTTNKCDNKEGGGIKITRTNSNNN